MIDFSSFTIKGAMVFQSESRHCTPIAVKRVVQQKDGSWWQYNFYKGGKVGTPLRGKDRQKYMLLFIEEVKAALK